MFRFECNLHLISIIYVHASTALLLLHVHKLWQYNYAFLTFKENFNMWIWRRVWITFVKWTPDLTLIRTSLSLYECVVCSAGHSTIVRWDDPTFVRFSLSPGTDYFPDVFKLSQVIVHLLLVIQEGYLWRRNQRKVRNDRPVSQMRAHLVTCRELTLDRDTFPKLLYVFGHKT